MDRLKGCETTRKAVCELGENETGLRVRLEEFVHQSLPRVVTEFQSCEREWQSAVVEKVPQDVVLEHERFELFGPDHVRDPFDVVVAEIEVRQVR